MTTLTMLAVMVATWAGGAALAPVLRRGQGTTQPGADGMTATSVARIARRAPRRGLRIGVLERQRQFRARHRASLELPDALELVVLAVRAGHLPPAAIRSTLPHVPAAVRPAFAEVVRRVDDGERFADAIHALVEHLGDDALVVVDTFAAADRYGLPIAPVLERLADDARRRRQRHAETLARQLPVRLSLPLVLCTLPSFVLLAVVPLLLAALSSLEW